jgi:ElaB/YqjD/DUF883 family membrane-anchored ribosome-binding protein
MKGTETITNTINKMTIDLKTVIDDAEVLLRNTREAPKTAYREAKARFERTIDHARGGVAELEHEVAGKVREAAHTTDAFVRDHAWNLAGAGVAFGLLVGLLARLGHRGLEREDH